MNLATTYLGLKLRTPLVPSASPLSEDIDNLKRMEDAGAAAIVFHSMFEDQIRRETHTVRPTAPRARRRRWDIFPRRASFNSRQTVPCSIS